VTTHTQRSRTDAGDCNPLVIALDRHERIVAVPRLRDCFASMKSLLLVLLRLHIRAGISRPQTLLAQGTA